MSKVLKGRELVDAAVVCATRAHEGQFRADKTTPYLVHPEDVAYLFRLRFDDILDDRYYQGTALAWLHDVVEPDAAHPLSFEELEERGFGSVLPELKLLTHEHITYLDYILSIRAARETHPLAYLVKLCDMEANLSTVDMVPHKGARKGLRTKYELARWILTH